MSRNKSILLNYTNDSQPKHLILSGAFLYGQSDVRYVLTSSLVEQRIQSPLVITGAIRFASPTVGVQPCFYVDDSQESSFAHYSSNSLRWSFGRAATSHDFFFYNNHHYSMDFYMEYDTGYARFAKRLGVGVSPLQKFYVDGDIALTGNLSNSVGHLILSSTIGSIIKVSGSLGLLAMTDVEKTALIPVAGMMIYNTDSGSFCVYTDAWKEMSVT